MSTSKNNPFAPSFLSFIHTNTEIQSYSKISCQPRFIVLINTFLIDVVGVDTSKLFMTVSDVHIKVSS